MSILEEMLSKSNIGYQSSNDTRFCMFDVICFCLCYFHRCIMYLWYFVLENGVLKNAKNMISSIHVQVRVVLPSAKPKKLG